VAIDVKLPDGTIVKDVPDNATQSQVLAIARAQGQSNKETLGREFTASVTDNLLGVPDLMLNASAQALNNLVRPVQRVGEGAAALMSGNFGEFAPANPLMNQPQVDHGLNLRNPLMTQNPAADLNLINTPALGQNFVMPTSEDVFAGADFLAQGAAGLDPSMEMARRNQQALTDVGRQENPFVAATGDILGDAMMLLSLRNVKADGVPISSQRTVMEVAHRRNIEAAKKMAEEGAIDIAALPNLRRVFRTIFDHGTNFNKLMRVSGRAAEAGLEGATIALLNEGDPLEVAAWSAGGQMGGSLFLSLSSGLLGGGIGSTGMKVLTSAAGVGALFQLLKVAGPPDDPGLISSIESGFPKIVAALALGAMSGAAGLGRISNKLPANAIPRVVDAISALPRGATISVLNEMLKDPAAATVVQKLASDPNFFGSAAARRIEHAMTDEKISISGVIEDLMGNRQFREAWESIQ
jgi:hypothetical protein